MKDIWWFVLLMLIGNIFSVFLLIGNTSTNVVDNTPEMQEKIAERDDLAISRQSSTKIVLLDRDTSFEKFYKITLLNIMFIVGGILAIKIDKKNEIHNNTN